MSVPNLAMTAALIAQRVSTLEASQTLAMAARAKALKAAGKPIVDFTAGEPDVDTPAHIKQAAIAAINEGFTKYTPSSGMLPLREAAAAKLSRDLALAIDPKQVIITCGAKHALFDVLQVLCQRGDDVLIPAPYWLSYPPLVELAEATPRIVPTHEVDGFMPSIDALKAAATKRTKALILNSPSNPTGAVYDKRLLQEIAALAVERGWWVISDEIYDALVFPPHAHVSIASLGAEIAARTIIVNGVSKAYAMTGWRIGYLAAPLPIAEAIDRLQSHSTSNPASISQKAALAALTGDQTCVREMARSFEQRRDRVVALVRGIQGITCVPPGGAFYAFLNISRLGLKAQEVSQRWLEEIFVATVPGESFGSDRHVRISFATSMAAVEEGLTRIGEWVGKRS